MRFAATGHFQENQGLQQKLEETQCCARGNLHPGLARQPKSKPAIQAR